MNLRRHFLVVASPLEGEVAAKRRVRGGFSPHLALLTLVLTACASTQAPPQRFYRLEAAPPAARTDFTATVLIGAVEAYGVSAERPLLFRASAAALGAEQYHYSLWTEPPALLLRDALTAHLRAALGEDRVLVVGTRTRPDLHIRTRLKRIEQIVDGASSRAALALEFTVTGAQNELLFVLEFAEEAAAAGLSIEDHVAALGQLLGKACGALQERLVQTVSDSTTGVR